MPSGITYPPRRLQYHELLLTGSGVVRLFEIGKKKNRTLKSPATHTSHFAARTLQLQLPPLIELMPNINLKFYFSAGSLMEKFH
jgi:hypothetical protein